MLLLFSGGINPFKSSNSNTTSATASELQRLSEVSALLAQINAGNFNLTLPELLQGTEVGNSILSINRKLISNQKSEERRTWTEKGLAGYFEAVNDVRKIDFNDKVNGILSFISGYVHALQSVFYIAEESNSGISYLRPMAGYAVDISTFEGEINAGNGIVGQLLIEKKSRYITDLPAGYSTIESGLGQVNPRALLVCPLIANNKIVGAIEFAFLSNLDTHKSEFIVELCNHIANFTKNEIDHHSTTTLLQKSNEMTEELRAQQEELRQNLEELHTTQEEILAKSNEIEEKSAESNSILQGINATMATIEFTPDGVILDANENFLTTMGCTMDRIRGEHHRLFVPNEIRMSANYKKFWSKLASGKSMQGKYNRITPDGKTVWLNAMYTPIKRSDGSVQKVVKFATDISAEQELIAENTGLLSGINATMATIEFSPEGNIINANDIFLKTVKYSLGEIKGKHHRLFVPNAVKESDEYAAFWKDLAEGNPNSGLFQRIDSGGNFITLNAIYNPIRNSEGRVFKIVKFATEIVQQKVAQLELKMQG